LFRDDLKNRPAFYVLLIAGRAELKYGIFSGLARKMIHKEIKMNKIMVGYDGTNAAKEAMNVAKKHAKAFDAQIYVLTSLIGGSEIQSGDIETAERGLEYAKEFFETHGIFCETHLLVRGMSPGEDMVRFAKENQIDEIFIGVKRRSKVGKLLFGSTAQYVILNAPCPVVTVR
jgi:nucleotide-binding universal stress UspA family protein